MAEYSFVELARALSTDAGSDYSISWWEIERERRSWDYPPRRPKKWASFRWSEAEGYFR